MECEHVQSQIRKFLKNQVEASEVEKVAKHIAECVRCRFVYQDVREELRDSGNASFPKDSS